MIAVILEVRNSEVLPVRTQGSLSLARSSAPRSLFLGVAGIPEKDAFKMVHGVVAKMARQSLIAACANYRENENNDIMIQLLKLSGLMTALPLPEGSAESELVAAGLLRAATLNERRVRSL